jgi:hypothetical protein
MKLLLMIFLMFAFMLVPADAQNARVRITKPAYPAVAVVAVLPIMFIAIEQNLCAFVAGSVAPDWPPDRQKLALGDCPPR